MVRAATHMFADALPAPGSPSVTRQPRPEPCGCGERSVRSAAARSSLLTLRSGTGGSAIVARNNLDAKPIGSYLFPLRRPASLIGDWERQPQAIALCTRVS